MTEQPIVIPRGEDCLIADFAAGGPDAVLVLPGWGGTRYGPQRILVQATAAFADCGFTTLRPDFRGRGDSSGEALSATLDGMIDDVRAAIDWLRETQHVQRINMVGLCSGGNVAMGAASLLPGDVDHVVCWSLLPFMEHKGQATRQGRDKKSLLRQMLRKAMRPEAWLKLLRGEANVQGAVKVLANDKEGDEAEKQRKTSARDILAELEAYHGKLHLLYGSRDPEASGSQAFFTDWCKQHRIPVDVRVIPGAPHNFYTAQWTAEVIEQTAMWLGS